MRACAAVVKATVRRKGGVQSRHGSRVESGKGTVASPTDFASSAKLAVRVRGLRPHAQGEPILSRGTLTACRPATGLFTIPQVFISRKNCRLDGTAFKSFLPAGRMR